MRKTKAVPYETENRYVMGLYRNGMTTTDIANHLMNNMRAKKGEITFDDAKYFVEDIILKEQNIKNRSEELKEIKDLDVDS
jgi:polyhydroxyalkanoate synthesis regulator phasin